MAWDPITESELNPGYAVLKHMRQAWNCLKYLYGQIGAASVGGGVSNGSFEVDSDADGIPDGWTFAAYPGGSGTVVSSSSAHGSNSFRFTHPGGAGNGGGSLTSDYIPISAYETAYALRFLIWSSVTGMRNYATVSWYTASKVFISTSILYNSTSSTPTPTWQHINTTPPSGARYAKIAIIGGGVDTNVAGYIYFDAVSFGGYVSNTQIFTSSGTWTKPTTGTMAKIEAWGGGGGAGAGTGYGGGGGEYVSIVMPLSALSDSVSVTIAAGGIGSGAGGQSSFGAYLTADGGYGYSGFGVGAGRSDGKGGNGATTTVAPQNATYAGAGGANSTFTTPGTSKFGGNGGAVNQNGTAPAGGAGETTVYATTGGRGEIRVTVW